MFSAALTNARAAEASIGKTLAGYGVQGHFSFNLKGYVAYLRYLLMPSAKKLLCDLDRDPWAFPRNVKTDQLLALCDKHTPQMDVRNGQAIPGGTRGRKRSLLTFSEITDAFVENHVKSAKDAWTLAKARKLAGDDTMFNTLHDKAGP